MIMIKSHTFFFVIFKKYSTQKCNRTLKKNQIKNHKKASKKLQYSSIFRYLSHFLIKHK